MNGDSEEDNSQNGHNGHGEFDAGAVNGDESNNL